ncbi:MAG: T9SS type A sorting domain-containing protein [Bacteroidota bacterium]
MKHYSLVLSVILLFALGQTVLQAQEAVNAAGGDGSGTGGSISYSVGGVACATSTGTTGSVAQGVQQPYEISVVSDIEPTMDVGLSYTAYPNPAGEYLTLTIEGELPTKLTLSLFDINGRALERKRIRSRETTISMTALLPAIYFLKVTDHSREVKTFKIIKK